MKYISEDDFYEIRLASVLSDNDRKILCDLYQPIVGSGAISLFFKLWADAEREREDGIFSMESLLTNMQVSTMELLSYRQHLEGMGLLRTFMRKKGDHRFFFLFICS